MLPRGRRGPGIWLHEELRNMTAAAITFVYNESVNLPIWVKYYGGQFGEKNLYVVDRGSDDGSTDNLGDVNVIKIPRNEFDEHEKTSFMSSLHSALLNFHRTVMISDCDEILAPDPDKYANLSEYIEKSDFDYVNCIGLDVLHLLTEEEPIDLSRPFLSQRRFARFHSPCCKHLISRVPMSWLPGFHSSTRPPKFDKDLYLFHTKVMDYAIAVKRQQINLDTVWSKASLDRNLGVHHRFSYSRFVHQNFLAPIDVLNRDMFQEFEFDEELNAIVNNTVVNNGYHNIPMNIEKRVKIPARFCNVL